MDGPISSGGDHTADTGDSSGERAVPLDALAGDDEGLSNMPDTHPQALLAEARQLVRPLPPARLRLSDAACSSCSQT